MDDNNTNTIKNNVTNQDHLNNATEFLLDSMVLLKNEGDILPFNGCLHEIVIIGD